MCHYENFTMQNPLDLRKCICAFNLLFENQIIWCLVLLWMVDFPLLPGVGRVETQVCPIKRRPPPFSWPRTRSSIALVMQPEIFTTTWIPLNLNNGSTWKSLKWNYTPLLWGNSLTDVLSIDLRIWECTEEPRFLSSIHKHYGNFWS